MAIKRSFEVIDKKTGNLVTKRTYASVDSNFLNELKTESVQGKITIFCCCSSRLELKISNTHYPYLYPATRGKKHGINCCRHSNYQGASDYEKAWKYNEETDELTVRMENLIPSGRDTSKTINDDKQNKIYINNSKSANKGKATVFGLATKLNMMAWEKIVTGNKNKLPENSEEVSKQLYGLTRNIRISNQKQSLQSMFYDVVLKGKKISDLNVKKDITFIYMKYKPQKNRTQEKIGINSYNFIVCTNAFGKEIGFYVDVNEFEQKLKLEPHSDTYIVAGFAYRASAYHHRKLTLGSYCLIPISENGLFVESRYEKAYYDKLCKYNLLFFKPYLPIEEYGDFIPDYMLFEEGKKPLIGEIFGIKGKEDYEERKEEKKAIAQTVEFRSFYRFKYTEPNKQ